MPSSIPRRREPRREQVRTHSLRALAVAARLERQHELEGPPGGTSGRTGAPTRRHAPDPA
ncbi:hypothetical protein [Actinomadura atramentaria]|uniref:hypothetical protein n=1 Tax=Actinomadura atramentaria TaxID=1990 RepID=UPI00036BDC22|nr:hypothetical protein [Actinomadura atramentaria]